MKHKPLIRQMLLLFMHIMDGGSVADNFSVQITFLLGAVARQLQASLEVRLGALLGAVTFA